MQTISAPTAHTSPRGVLREVVWYGDIYYYRYPHAKGASDRAYYKPEGGLKSGRQPLHRQVWIDHHGPIPTGYEVHHKDSDTLNNDIDNFELLTVEEHDAIHASHQNQELREARAQHANRIRPLAAAWHGTVEGRSWHSLHAAQSWSTRSARNLRCQHCQSHYQTKKPHSTKYCSGRCRTAARRKRTKG